MKCVYCPIDTRLNFHQVSKLLKEVQVRPGVNTVSKYGRCAVAKELRTYEFIEKTLFLCCTNRENEKQLQRASRGKNNS